MWDHVASHGHGCHLAQTRVERWIDCFAIALVKARRFLGRNSGEILSLLARLLPMKSGCADSWSMHLLGAADNDWQHRSALGWNRLQKLAVSATWLFLIGLLDSGQYMDISWSVFGRVLCLMRWGGRAEVCLQEVVQLAGSDQVKFLNLFYAFLVKTM